MSETNIPNEEHRNNPPAISDAIDRSHNARDRETKSVLGTVSFQVMAVIIAERIDLKLLGKLPVIAQAPLTARLPSGGVVAIFRYGAVSFFAEARGDRDWLLSTLRDAMSGEGDPGTEEEISVEVGQHRSEGMVGDVAHIPDARIERVQLLAEAIAKSVLLSFYERRLATDFDRAEPLAQDLAEDGRFSASSRELLKTVGSMLLPAHQLTGRAEVMDKPDLLWENPSLESLYARLEGEFELRERALALERKLTTLSKTAETLVEAVRHKQTLRVEWYIVILIVVEIALSLYEKL
jgi:uncharacterized Rmd1/YagE family protein